MLCAGFDEGPSWSGGIASDDEAVGRGGWRGGEERTGERGGERAGERVGESTGERGGGRGTPSVFISRSSGTRFFSILLCCSLYSSLFDHFDDYL